MNKHMRRMWMLPGSGENSILWGKTSFEKKRKKEEKRKTKRLHSYILTYAVETNWK